MADEGALPAGHRHIETAEAPPLTKAGWFVDALARRLPYSVAKYRGRPYADAARRATAEADLVLVHAQVGLAASEIGGKALVHLAYNVEHEVYAGEATRARSVPLRLVLRREARLIEAVERSLIARASAVWCLTAGDAERFGALGARRAVAFDVPGRPAAAAVPGRERRGVALIGNWTWEPNEVGLRWFAEQVVPLMRPDVPVEVAGAGAEWLDGHPRIRRLGRVDDAGAFLAGARVVAIPAQAGGGIQVKTLDALAEGAWVVATPLALRGIAEPPVSVRIASDVAAFAQAVDALVRDPATLQPSSSAREWARAREAAFNAAVAAEAAVAAL